ncbi:MAG: ribbon-helix-helix domain-containing protein [Candidatus Brocadiaceae bacterium]|nr:ribbon-helix-helix domain-containing protein [Candidatus Brocadiaceae bacterium]
MRDIRMGTSHSNEKELVPFRFHKDLKQKLAHLSEATGRSQTFLAEEAIKQYCDLLVVAEDFYQK